MAKTGKNRYFLINTLDCGNNIRGPKLERVPGAAADLPGCVLAITAVSGALDGGWQPYESPDQHVSVEMDHRGYATFNSPYGARLLFKPRASP